MSLVGSDHGSFDTLNNLVVACLTEAAVVSHLIEAV